MIVEPSNVGPGETVDELTVETFANLDALPPPLRNLIKYAPLDYAVVPYFMQWRQLRGSYTEAEIANMWAREMVADRRAAALEDYGPTHPQAA